jgi:hypothetical protein
MAEEFLLWLAGIAVESAPRVAARRRISHLLAADAASPQDAAMLGVQVGAPIQRHRSFRYDGRGRAVEYSESILPLGEPITFDYRIQDAASVGEE